MSPITLEEAKQYVDPSLSKEPPGPGQPSPFDQSAQRIVDGVAANEVYWNHRDGGSQGIDSLRARAEGHGQVVRVADEKTQDAAVEPRADAEAVATDEPATGLGAGAAPASSEVPPPAPDNSNEAIARLRAQVENLGGTPEA